MHATDAGHVFSVEEPPFGCNGLLPLSLLRTVDIGRIAEDTSLLSPLEYKFKTLPTVNIIEDWLQTIIINSCFVDI
jgi:hypothetical protein